MAARPRPRSVDYRLDDLTLNAAGRRFDLPIDGSLTTDDFELTIEGADTLTLGVDDNDFDLLRSATLTGWTWGEKGNGEEGWAVDGRDVNARLDKRDYRLVKVAKTGPALTLTLENLLVSELRRVRGARKWPRSKMTRAEVILAMAREADPDMGVHIPELRRKQPIEKASRRVRDDQRHSDGKKGIAADDLTVKGVKASPEQVRNMERACDVADSLDAPRDAWLALIEACIAEAEFRNLAGGDGTSTGILQLLASTAANLHVNPRDVEAVCHLFLTAGFTGTGGAIHLARSNPDWSPAEIAHSVQGNATGTGAYSAWADEAKKILDAYNGGGGRINGEYRTKAYQFERKRGESSWDAMGRLAEEVAWRRFVRDNRLWYVSEDYLFRQKPALVVEQGKNGVDWVDFEIDLGARNLVAELTVTARAERWTAEPGMVVTARETGPANGRWLVTTVAGSLTDEAVTVTLHKPIPAKPEPAAERVAVRGRGVTVAKQDDVDAVYDRAVEISKKNLPYSWGGGHGKAGVPSGSPAGYDCSGYVSACLLAGGMLPDSAPLVSGAFASSWGKPGKGKAMTVWANGDHVFIEFYGRKAKRADTSPHGDGGEGPHVRYTTRSTAGFTPRHWPGT